MERTFFKNLNKTIKKIFLLIKMASVRDLKVRQLTKLAKEQGLKGYSKKK